MITWEKIKISSRQSVLMFTCFSTTPINIGILLSLKHIYHSIFRNYIFSLTYRYSALINSLQQTIFIRNPNIHAPILACIAIFVPNLRARAPLLFAMLCGVHASRSHTLASSNLHIINFSQVRIYRYVSVSSSLSHQCIGVILI